MVEFEYEDIGAFSDAAHAAWIVQHGAVFVEHALIPRNTKILAMDDHHIVLSKEVNMYSDGITVTVCHRTGDFPDTVVSSVSGDEVTFADPAVDDEIALHQPPRRGRNRRGDRGGRVRYRVPGPRNGHGRGDSGGQPPYGGVQRGAFYCVLRAAAHLGVDRRGMAGRGTRDQCR